MRYFVPVMLSLTLATVLPVMARSPAPPQNQAPKLDLLASVRLHVRQMQAAPVLPTAHCPVAIRLPSGVSYEADQKPNGETRCFSVTATFTPKG